MVRDDFVFGTASQEDYSMDLSRSTEVNLDRPNPQQKRKNIWMVMVQEDFVLVYPL